MNEVLLSMGRRISAIRKINGMTQEQLADKAGVATQTISAAELGKKALRPENVIKLSQALQVSTDYLLTGNRNTTDYSLLNGRLASIDQKKYDRIMRIVEIMLEEC